MGREQNKRFNPGEQYCQEVLFSRYSVISKISVHSKSPDCRNWKIKRTVLFSNLEYVNGSHSKSDGVLINIENIFK